jgi:beta-lactamase regulating signal transducer with metallopeptidase domain
MFSASGTLSSLVGWAMVHILWAVAGLYLVHLAVQWLLRRFSAHIQYVAACSSLTLVVLCSAAIVYVPFALDHHLPFAPQLRAFAAVTGIDPIDTEPRLPINGDPYYEIARVTDQAAFRQLVRAAEPVVQWLGVVWVVGALMRLLVPLMAAIGLGRIVRCSEELPLPFDARQTRTYQALCGQLLVPVYITSRLKGPCTTGWLKPVILMPASLITQLTPDELLCVLAHEIAHIRRRDFMVNLLQIAAEAVLFFHPCVWLMSRRIRVLREACCDDVAVAAVGSREQFGRTLVRVENLRHETVLALGMADASVPSRIMRLHELKYFRPRENYSRFATVLVTVVLLVMLGATPVARLAEDYDDQADVLKFGSSRLILQNMGLRRDNPDLWPALQRLADRPSLRGLTREDLQEVVDVASRGALEQQLIDVRLHALRLEMSPTYADPGLNRPRDTQISTIAGQIFKMTLTMPASPERDKWFRAAIVLSAQESWTLHPGLTNPVRHVRFAELSGLRASQVAHYRRLTAVEWAWARSGDDALRAAMPTLEAYQPLIRRFERPISTRRYIAADIAFRFPLGSNERRVLADQFRASGGDLDRKLGDLIDEPLTGTHAYIGRDTGGALQPPVRAVANP